jgi:hypothetical protein
MEHLSGSLAHPTMLKMLVILKHSSLLFYGRITAFYNIRLSHKLTADGSNISFDSRARIVKLFTVVINPVL